MSYEQIAEEGINTEKVKDDINITIDIVRKADDRRMVEFRALLKLKHMLFKCKLRDKSECIFLEKPV